MARVIWIDDDSFGILSVLVLRLKRHGFTVEKFKYFEDAESFLNEEIRTSDSILIDFILPSKEVRVSAFLGLKLAEIALRKNIKNITFLSVVDEAEVREDLDKMFPSNGNNNQIKYKYFNKAKIVEKEEFLSLIDSLKKII